jgi:hypothetical protein
MKIREEVCSHPGCECSLELRSVSYGDRSFCSGDCADGIGCEHENCTCRSNQRQASGFTSFIQDAVRHLHR